MKDKYGIPIVSGVTIQFDDDYFGHGMTRVVSENANGVLGFHSIPGKEEMFCYVKDWVKEIEVVTENTVIRRHGKHITLSGRRHFW